MDFVTLPQSVISTIPVRALRTLIEETRERLDELDREADGLRDCIGDLEVELAGRPKPGRKPKAQEDDDGEGQDGEDNGQNEDSV